MSHEGKAPPRGTDGDSGGGFDLFTLRLDSLSILLKLSLSAGMDLGFQLSVLASHAGLRVDNVCLYYFSLNTVNVLLPKNHE